MVGSTKSGERDTPRRTSFADLERRTVFTDLSVFDTDYIPEEIFVRREFQPVVRFYFDCLKFQLQQALVIVGATGSGKTLAARYYARLLRSPAGEAGMTYAQKRGWTAETVKQMGLGYSDGQLLAHLREEDVNLNVALEAGIITRRQDIRAARSAINDFSSCQFSGFWTF